MRLTHTAESFWEFNNPISEGPTRSWVGPYPRLATPDAAASYAEISPGDSLLYAGAGIRLPAFTWPIEGLRIRGQIRFSGEWVGDRAGGFAGILLQSPTVGGWIHDWNLAGPGGPPTAEVFATADPSHPGWALFDFVATPDWVEGASEAAAVGDLWVSVVGIDFVPTEGLDISWIRAGDDDDPGILAIDTHDHPYHFIGTRDPAMPYELVIDTGTERLVEIVAGEEHLATHELVIDETGRPGTDWSHAGLFRPI